MLRFHGGVCVHVNRPWIFVWNKVISTLIIFLPRWELQQEHRAAARADDFTLDRRYDCGAAVRPAGIDTAVCLNRNCALQNTFSPSMKWLRMKWKWKLLDVYTSLKGAGNSIIQRLWMFTERRIFIRGGLLGRCKHTGVGAEETWALNHTASQLQLKPD